MKKPANRRRSGEQRASKSKGNNWFSLHSVSTRLLASLKQPNPTFKGGFFAVSAPINESKLLLDRLDDVLPGNKTLN